MSLTHYYGLPVTEMISTQYVILEGIENFSPPNSQEVDSQYV